MVIAVELRIPKEVLLNTHLQAQLLLSSWFHQLANSGHSNRHLKLPQPQTLTQHLRAESP
jgi:hypothetical protein